MANMVTPTKDRNGTYIIRFGVPKELQMSVGKKELKRSLGTKVLREAKLAAPAVIAEIQAIVQVARLELESESLLTPQFISSIVQSWFAQKHSELELSLEHINQYLQEVDGGFEPLDLELPSLLNELEYYPGNCPDRTRRLKRLKGYMGEYIDEALTAQGLAISTTSPQYDSLLIGFSVKYIKLTELALRRRVYVNKMIAEGLFENPVEEAQFEQCTTPLNVAMTSNIDQTFQEVFEAYSEAVIRREGKNAQARLADYSSAVSKFSAYFPGVCVTKITKRMVAEFMELLEKLPTRPKKDVKSLSLREQVERADRDSLPRLATSTVNKQVQGISAVFTYALNKGIIKVNPAHGVAKNLVSVSSTEASGYLDSELDLIFGSPIYRSNFKPQKADYGQAHYWLPLILYYTGARAEEIAQLHVGDVKFDEAVPHFYLSDDMDDQTIKTGQSRVVPIHEHLLELGFNRYVTGLDPAGRLFPRLQPSSLGKYHYSLSKWLAKYFRGELGVDREGIKPLHDFRHAFITKCRVLDIREDTQNAITGHSQGAVGRGYGSYPLDTLKRAIDQIPRCIVSIGLRASRN
jgi:integrase